MSGGIRPSCSKSQSCPKRAKDPVKNTATSGAERYGESRCGRAAVPQSLMRVRREGYAWGPLDTDSSVGSKALSSFLLVAAFMRAARLSQTPPLGTKPSKRGGGGGN